MTKVVFIGDEPSNLNIDIHVPFVGAKCFQRLVQWINYIKPDYYICLNSNNPEDLNKVFNLHYKGKFRIVAIGNKASNRLTNNRIAHWKIPHPSGRNIQINNKIQIEKELSMCKDWINGLYD